MLGGMLFEELGFRYIGPVNGHDIGQLQKYWQMVRQAGPVLLHVVTEKGHGFKPAAEDRPRFHAPAPFHPPQRLDRAAQRSSSSRSYTGVVRDALSSRCGPTRR